MLRELLVEFLCKTFPKNDGSNIFPTFSRNSFLNVSSSLTMRRKVPQLWYSRLWSIETFCNTIKLEAAFCSRERCWLSLGEEGKKSYNFKIIIERFRTLMRPKDRFSKDSAGILQRACSRLEFQFRRQDFSSKQ